MAPASNVLSTELFDLIIARAAGDAGISGDEADRVFERLKQNKLDNVTGLAHFEFGLLRNENTRPDGLNKLKALIVGPGAGAAPDDAPELNTMLSSLADGIAKAWVEHTTAVDNRNGNGKSEKDDEVSDRNAATSAYADLDRWQGRAVSLEDKVSAGCIGRMRKEVLSSSHIETVPSVRNVPKASKTGTKREVNIGELSDGNTVRFQVAGDGGSMNAKSLDKVQDNMRALITAIVAAYSRPIAPSAYGGGQAGYVRVPMEARQVRLQMDLASADRLIFKLIKCATAFQADLDGYVNMCDRVIFEFLKLGEPLTMHPSDIVNHLVEVRPNLFAYSYESGDSGDSRRSESKSTASGAADGAAPKDGAGRAICKSWLENGNCRAFNEGKCESSHPPARQGALMNSGKRGGGGGGGGSWYHPYSGSNWQQGQSGWNSNQSGWNSGWNQSKGKGKGSGGKGKGGGGKSAGKGGSGKGKGGGGRWW